MSYYHYFKLKEDSYYNTVEDSRIKYQSNGYGFNNPEYAKGLIKASLINFYYDKETPLEQKWTTIWNYILKFEAAVTVDLPNCWVREIREDEDHELVRNRPMEEYDMEDLVENFDTKREELISELLILSCIRFEADDKYSDTPKTTAEYLEYNFCNRIEDKLSYFEEQCIDYEFAKFCTTHCTRQTEDEKYKDEDNEEGN